MIRLLLMLLVGILSPPSLHAQTPKSSLVLVANAQSAIKQLSPAAVRKLYLGVPMIVENHRVRPLRNNTDPMVQEMFMQKVMFMSTPAYERQILSQVFRMGGTRPFVYVEIRDLLRALETDPFAVTFLPRGLAITRPGLKIVGEL